MTTPFKNQLWLMLISALWLAVDARGSVTPPALQIANQTNSTPVFTWAGTKGQTYLVEYKTNLLQTNWNVLTGVVVTNNATATGHDSMNHIPDNRYYRLWILSTNAADVTKPTITITAPTTNQLWSNAVFLVNGKASDNKQVAAVLYQLNSNYLAGAVTTNNWTNWTASVALTPGTNTVSAYAVDTSANYSTTQSVNFVYVVGGILQIRAIGLGTLSPNYSNAVLQVGKNYSMAATGINGFAFTNWMIFTNGVVAMTTNSAMVQFLMQSNLLLQVTFVDVTSPTVTINPPTFAQQGSNEVLTVTGTAGDNVQVGNVSYQLNGTGWMPATSTNNWTNWIASVILSAGTNSGVATNLLAGANTVQAKAVDGSGHPSITNHVNFNYTKPTLTVNVLPHAQVGQYYSCAHVGQGTGGFPPYYFVKQTGANFPPVGMIVDLNGCLSGTASIAGTYTFGVTLVDLSGSEVSQNVTIVVDPVYTLTINTDGGTGTGTVVATPPGYPPGLIYTNGTKVTLTAITNAVSTFGGWSGAVSGILLNIPITINGNQTVTATFNPVPLSLAGSGGKLGDFLGTATGCGFSAQLYTGDLVYFTVSNNGGGGPTIATVTATLNDETDGVYGNYTWQGEVTWNGFEFTGSLPRANGPSLSLTMTPGAGGKYIVAATVPYTWRLFNTDGSCTGARETFNYQVNGAVLSPQ